MNKSQRLHFLIKAAVPKKWVSLFIPFFRKLRSCLCDVWAIKSYSQEGEDMILRRFFEGKSKGFYVDIGAHHPKRFSNTYYFYKMGWRGINIDAMPGSMSEFNRIRPDDINLEIPVANEPGIMTFFIFNEPALNSFDSQLSEKRNGMGDYKIVKKETLHARRLCDILAEFLPQNQGIDFLNIDVEGMDFQVLQSNDWQKYRPKIVLVEILDNRMEKIGENGIFKLLKSNNYSVVAKSFNTVFFEDDLNPANKLDHGE